MKRYNLSKIMKRAHENYNSKMWNMGRTFGQCLKDAWAVAKSEVALREEREAKAREIEERERRMQVEKSERTYNPYNRLDIPASAFYNPNSIGLYGAHYVGD